MGKEMSFSVFAVQQYKVGDSVVSSTVVREAIAAGEMERASASLGYSFTLSGTVIRGDGRGKGIGYPTANILPSSQRKIVPGNGVYLVGVTIGGKSFHGMMNIGTRPTFGTNRDVSIEVHVFGLNRDVYGETVTVTFKRKLRDEQKFSSREELIRQLDVDKEVSQKMITEFETRN